jgi:peptide/nickel transport system permease protein
MVGWKAFMVRIVLAAATVAVGGLLSATLARYAPGFGSDERQLDTRFSTESRHAIQQESSSEKDVGTYYWRALSSSLRGDLGESHLLHRPIRKLLRERAPTTIRLVAGGLALSWMATLLLIFLTWVWDSAPLNIASSTLCGVLLCIPAGAIALLLIVANGPAFVAIALVVFPKTYRYSRSLIHATARMPHLFTARAKGVAATRLLLWHIIPVIRRELLALAGVSLGVAAGAAIPVEVLSGESGIGQLAWQSALSRDLPTLTCVSLLVIGCTVLANSGAAVLADERTPAR